jgi:dihydrodipicolinate synthase/N-acetylneuraminate lyase
MAQSAIASHAPSVADLLVRVKPRPIEGISALLLAYREDGRPDLDAFAAHLERTVAAGLKPSVNMDTGYVNLLTAEERERVLRVTVEVMRGRPFVAGAFVEGASPTTEPSPSLRSGSGQAGRPTTDSEGSVQALVALYCREAERVREYGGTPIVFQCSALKALPDAAVVEVYRAVAERMGEIIGFELGEMFAPFGWIYPIEVFAELIQIEGLVGMKHSSLDRAAEWERLALRDRVRPGFKLYTGNDLGIDMVMYGSDYLLGLSTFAPEAFGLRDRYWAAGDARFFALNDALQYLGAFAFRPPVPGYKHSAAQFLHLRGQIPTAAAHPASPRRPESDVPILREIAERVESLTS